MEQYTLQKHDELVMKLLHYFITEKGYNPIILHGVQNEIWLENLDSDYKIVRIVSNYIHNNDQFDFDVFKTKQIMKKIKKKTLSFHVNSLSIFVNLGENVNLKNTKLENMEFAPISNIEDLNKYKNILEVFPDITKETEYKEEGLNLFLKLTNDINKKNQEDAIKNEEIFSIKKPIVTYSLIIINVIVFILMALLEDGISSNPIIELGALYPSKIANGEYYRLLTCIFLHSGILHLICNNYALYIIGIQLESFLGKIKFLVIYLISGLAGSLMSMLFTNGISVGASGAIFGLLGSLLYFGYNYRVYLGNVIKSQILPIIILNLGIGFLIPNIDNSAHIGGLVGGILITMALGLKHKSTKIEKINGTILTIIYFGFLIYMSFIVK